MRILDAFSSLKIGTSKQKSQSTTNKSLVTSLFSSEMKQKENEIDDYDRDIDGLRKEVDSAGEKLQKEPTIPNFSTFRENLSRLAKRINTEAYRLEKCGGTPQNPRYYEIITTINFEADKLYNLVIKEQKDNLAITAKVIGIKGLVVDLLT